MLYSKSNPSTIQSLFDAIAQRYDMTNTIMSLSLHKIWKKRLIKSLEPKLSSHGFLDICAGTGEIAFCYLNRIKAPCSAYLVDFSSEMLKYAKKKEKKFPLSHHTLHYLEADAHLLPLEDLSIDRAAMAYGIRNLHNPLMCLKEVLRVLKPGGAFAILELTVPRRKILQKGHQFYLKYVLPFIGKYCASNSQAYDYLQNSIRTFISPLEIENLLQLAGFSSTSQECLGGGIATIIKGTKAT